jgi:hypothetical protein
MNFGLLLLLTFVYGVIFLLVQRTEAQRRRLVGIFFILLTAVIQWYVSQRGETMTGVAALIVALILNLLFWAIIGRYNPVGSSDDTHVIGMDD